MVRIGRQQSHKSLTILHIIFTNQVFMWVPLQLISVLAHALDLNGQKMIQEAPIKFISNQHPSGV